MAAGSGAEAAGGRRTGAARAAPALSRLRGALQRHETLRGYGLIAPLALLIGLLVGVPLLYTLVLSLWHQTNFVIERTWTVENLRQALIDPQYRALLLRSLWISGAATVLTLLLAYPIAYFIAFYGGLRKLVWVILFTIPFWTSYLLRIFAWKVMLGCNGVINSGLKQLGLIDQPIEALLYNPLAVVVTLTHAWLPFALLPIYVSLEKIDRSLLEAATDLGDGPTARFLRVTLPLSLPGITAAAVMIFIPTIGDYITPALVGGPDGLMIANAIAELYGRLNNWPLGSALSLVSIATVSIISLLYLALSRLAARQVR
jgi:spermidine/putrescine transport system permease protein